MYDSSGDSEEIVIRRIQRRLERYFAESEKLKTTEQEFKQEAQGTQIVVVKTPESVPMTQQDKVLAKVPTDSQSVPTTPQPAAPTVASAAEAPAAAPVKPPPPPPVSRASINETTKKALSDSAAARVAINVKPLEHPAQAEPKPPKTAIGDSASKSHALPSRPKAKPPRSVSSPDSEASIDEVVLSGARIDASSKRSLVPTLLFVFALLVISALLALWYLYTSGSLPGFLLLKQPPV